MVADLIGGQVQVALDVVAGSLAHIRSGAARALAVTTATRLDSLPDVPTVAETLPGYEAVAFTGIGVPTGTPEPIIARLNHDSDFGVAWWDAAIRGPRSACTPDASGSQRRKLLAGGQRLVPVRQQPEPPGRPRVH